VARFQPVASCVTAIHRTWLLKEILPMFRQVSRLALVVLVALGSLTLATAQESKEAGGKTKSPPKELTVDLGKGVKLDLALIPAGEFMMGSPDSDEHALNSEKPQHRVRITKPFYLGKYLVTQEQWQAVMGENPSHFKGPKNPVEQVSWDDCQGFLKKLNTGFASGKNKFALPTEAQWEFACRAGTTTRYCFGDDESQLGDYAWYDKNSGGKTHAVGGKKPNAFGLYDMHGNVFEWCADWSNWYQRYKDSRVDDPSGPPTGVLARRVYRGGSWDGSAWFCRSMYRDLFGLTPEGHDHRLGLRVALIPADN
jgi:formylglycine-generating enzyme required for sulfatase activity